MSQLYRNMITIIMGGGSVYYRKNKRGNESGGNHKESTGKKVGDVLVMRRVEHYVGRRAKVMKVGIHGKGIEDALREDGWTN